VTENSKTIAASDWSMPLTFFSELATIINLVGLSKIDCCVSVVLTAVILRYQIMAPFIPVENETIGSILNMSIKDKG